MIQDHFERHAHQKGKQDWNFNVVFNDQPAVAAMAEAYAPILDHPGIYEPIPAQWLHATILRVGTTDEYTEAEMLAVAERVQQSVDAIKFPEFHFGHTNLIYGNVCFDLEPYDAFAQLYEVVAAALEQIVGPERATKTPYGKFIAHTSFAYTKSHDNEAEYRARLDAATIEPAHFRVTHMPLIRQWPTDGHYEWEVVKDITVS